MRTILKCNSIRADIWSSFYCEWSWDIDLKTSEEYNVFNHSHYQYNYILHRCPIFRHYALQNFIVIIEWSRLFLTLNILIDFIGVYRINGLFWSIKFALSTSSSSPSKINGIVSIMYMQWIYIETED